MTLPNPITTEADVHAMRALFDGVATQDQQIRAGNYIGQQLCRIFDSPYVAEGSDRETFIMLGRHQVGVMINHLRTPEALADARAYDKAPEAPPKRGTRK